jgi:hypothetical protein
LLDTHGGIEVKGGVNHFQQVHQVLHFVEYGCHPCHVLRLRLVLRGYPAQVFVL